MTLPSYPKVSQEMIRDVMHVIKESMANTSYIENSPYSHLMRDVISREVKDISFAFARGKVGSGTHAPGASSKTPEQIDAELTSEIKKQFTAFSTDLENRTDDFRDDFGILVRLEKTIRSVEKLMNSGATDSVKLQASTRFMDLQEKQLDLLERLANISRVTKIEAMTKRFFNELKKHPDMKIIAERYLTLLEEMA